MDILGYQTVYHWRIHDIRKKKWFLGIIEIKETS